MKFNDDLSDIREEAYGYYKYYVYNFVISFLNQNKVKGKKILDLGCGPGFYSAILAQFGANVIGIDKCEFLVKKAVEHKSRHNIKNVDFYCADFAKIPLGEKRGNFDFIISIDTVVSFDFCQTEHNHKEVVNAFRNVRKLLNDDGRFLIIESHPFFGDISIYHAKNDSTDYIDIGPSGYKFEYKKKGYPHHWFTLEEMTKAISESGMAILRIYEPDPSKDLKNNDIDAYLSSLKYPSMIVYEMCRL